MSDFGYTRPRCSRHSNAGKRNCRRSNPGSGAGPPDGFVKYRSHTRFAAANQAASCTRGAGQNGSLVSNYASRLATTAVNAQEDRHNVVLSSVAACTLGGGVDEVDALSAGISTRARILITLKRPEFVLHGPG